MPQVFNPTEYDLKVLRLAAGEDVPDMAWGAAMSVALEYLAEAGLMTLEGKITDAGREYLERVGNGND